MHQAIEFYEQNVRLSRETGDQRGEMSALSSLGRTYDALEERDKAIECYEQALKIARQIGDMRGERQLLKGLNEIQNFISEGRESNDQAKLLQKLSGKPNSTRNKSSRRQTSKQSRASKKIRPLKDQE